MGIKTVKIADRIYHFEAAHGHLVTTALQSLVEQQHAAAEKARGTMPVVADALEQSSAAYARALDAWQELSDALGERD